MVQCDRAYLFNYKRMTRGKFDPIALNLVKEKSITLISWDEISKSFDSEKYKMWHSWDVIEIRKIRKTFPLGDKWAKSENYRDYLTYLNSGNRALHFLFDWSIIFMKMICNWSPQRDKIFRSGILSNFIWAKEGLKNEQYLIEIHFLIIIPTYLCS